MKPRLLRALQRGGVAASSGADTWHIWRSQDRCGRIIGSLSGAEIDILRLRHDLKPLGDDKDQVLIWTGRLVERDRASLAAPDIGHPGSEPQNRSLLEMLIANCASPVLRTRIRYACQVYRQDLEDVSRGTSTTMNWDGLARGRLAKGQGQRSGFESRTGKRAEQCLARVADLMGQGDHEFLLKLVVREASRSSIAKAYATRPALAEQKGMSILRKLLAAYGL